MTKFKNCAVCYTGIGSQLRIAVPITKLNVSLFPHYMFGVKFSQPCHTVTAIGDFLAFFACHVQLTKILL